MAHEVFTNVPYLPLPFSRGDGLGLARCVQKSLRKWYFGHVLVEGLER